MCPGTRAHNRGAAAGGFIGRGNHKPVLEPLDFDFQLADPSLLVFQPLLVGVVLVHQLHDPAPTIGQLAACLVEFMIEQGAVVFPRGEQGRDTQGERVLVGVRQ